MNAVMKSPRGLALVLLVVFAGVALVVFHALWSPNTVLMTSDDNVGLVAASQRVIAAAPLAHWTGETLWGLPGLQGFHLWALAMGLLPAEFFMNVYHRLCLTLAAWLLALYLRDKGLRPAACVFGGLVAFWVGTNLTLTYAGHVGKYGLMVFLALAVFALGRWGKTGRAAWSLVAGAAAGAMFLEQADVALFCALLLLPLGVYEAARAGRGWQPLALIRTAWPAALAAGLIAGGASLTVVGAGVTEVPNEESPAAKWAYITQWSQPPGESLDFIAPGWTGWRSGEPSGPYWGKMGRSEGYEQTRQGFMNFKLENVYVGAIPLLFALIGLAAAVRRRREPGAESATVLVWGGLCLLALLLAFGKFFPLYRLVAALPGFGTIRNPNKFIHFFQMAWGVLAAFGLEAALRLDARAAKKWIWGAGVVAGIFLMSGLALWADLTTGAARLSAAGWGPELGRAIQWNKAFSVTYAAGALLLGAGVVWLLAGPRNAESGRDGARPSRNSDKREMKVTGGTTSVSSGRYISASWAVWLPAVVVLFDAAVILAPKYIQTMPPGYVAENELVRYLKRDLGHNRMAMATQDGFYNLWLTYLFPYHGIPSVNVTQLPRPPADYTAFWQAVRDPVRMWRLAAVSHVLARGPVAAQLLSNPEWAAQLAPAWAYEPRDDGRGGVATRSLPVSTQAPEVVLKMKEVPPRVAAVQAWRTVADDEALKTLADPAFTPYATLLLAPDNPEVSPGSGAPGAAAEVNLLRAVPGRYEFTVKNQGPVMIRVAEKFDPNWKARVNGQPVPVLRADYMFQVVALAEAGEHRVEMRYAPPAYPVLMQGAGILAGLGALGWLGLSRRRVGKAA